MSTFIINTNIIPFYHLTQQTLLFSGASALLNKAPMARLTTARGSAVEVPSMEEPMYVPPPVKKALNAKWFPFFNVKAPIMLDGTLAGDAGFDPLRLGSGSEKTLYWMREAEVKHGRLAMLAAIGWPLSELLHKEIASALGWTSILASNDRAPSLLNGGLSTVYATTALMLSIVFAGYLEGKAMNEGSVFWAGEKPEGYTPGNMGFDPLNLYKARKDKKVMETAEIKNGRLAMVAITAYAFSEFLSGQPVTQLTPFLF